MKTSKKIQLAVLVALSQVQFIAAQTPGFDDDVQDVPIDNYNWIIPVTVIGIGFLRFHLRKQQPQIK